jgi:hypothetical protein
MIKIIEIRGGGNSVKNTGSFHSRQIFFFKYIVLNKNVGLYCTVLFTATGIAETLKY